MELEGSTCLTSDYTTELQSSRQYGTGRKTEIQINGTKQKARDKSTHLWPNDKSMTKKTIIQSGEKTVSSISGAGKTVKE